MMSFTLREQIPVATVFRHGRARIRVEAPADDLQWLREFCTPLFEESPETSCDSTVRVFVDDAEFASLGRRIEWTALRPYDCFTLDGGFEQWPGCEPSANETWIDARSQGVVLVVRRDRRSVEIVTSRRSTRRRLFLMRTLRELATVEALREGALPLHAAATFFDGSAVCIAGAKRSGKTTLLLQGLLTGRTFVANDRAFAEVDEDRWTIRGIPTIIKIRAETLDLFLPLRQAADARPWHWEQSLDETMRIPRRASRTPEASSFSLAQFLKITAAAANSGGPAGMILFPEWNDSVRLPECRPLSASDAAHRLSESLLRPGPCLKTSEALDFEGQRNLESDANRRCLHMAAAAKCLVLQRRFRSPNPWESLCN